MFEKLLVVSDMSPSSDAIIRCLGNLKKYGAKECTLLQCISTQEISSLAFSYSTSIIEHILEDKKKTLEGLDFKVRTKIISDFPKKVVNKIAVTGDYSIVVVGEIEHSRAGEMLFDRLTYGVIHTSEKPVLVIRLVMDEKKDYQKVRAVKYNIDDHILFPTDFSKNADHAFEYLKKMISDGIKKVTIMHVEEGPGSSSYEKLEVLKNKLSEYNDIKIDLVEDSGNPTKKILEVVDEKNISLVVMGSQGKGFIKELFVGSVSHDIARHANASVLLIPFSN
ncbi:MAG TPA: universal stress protein [Clostridia bacterium]|nr:universal stress protein [Clostridia bacterium]